MLYPRASASTLLTADVGDTLGKQPRHASVATDAVAAQRNTTIERIAAGRGTVIIGSRRGFTDR